MSVDNSTGEPDAAIQHKSATTNGGQGDHVNGVSNGYPEKHKSSHKSSSHDKHRSKDKDRERSKDHKSSSSKHHSSSSNRDKDKEKHSSSKDKDRSHSHSHKSSTKDKDRERSDKDKDKSSDKERTSDKERSSDKEKHRSKEHKSSSKDKDGERKESSSSSSHREKSDKDKSKHKHSSSSRDHDHKEDKHSSKSKDKDRHHRDKERSKEKSSKHRESSSKSKSREGGTSSREVASSVNEFVHPGENASKEESDSYDIPAMKIEVESQEDIKAQLNESQSSCDYSLTQFKDEPKEELPDEDEDYEDQEQESEEQEEKVPVKVEETEDSEEDIPLRRQTDKKNAFSSARINNSKRKIESESEDDVPISQRKKKKSEKKSKKAKKRSHEDFDEDEDVKPAKTKSKVKKEKGIKKEIKNEITETSPTKRKKKAEEEQEVWKWWEEEKKNDGTKWHFLEHKGPMFAPPYERLPSNIKFYYNGQEMALSEDAEEVACFYAKMLTHDYTSKPVFNENFFKDWRKTMTEKEKSIIKDLSKCDFRKMNAYFTELSEKNKQRTKEEKQKIKEQNEAIVKEYGFCKIDGHTEKIGNFRIEPPGLFRGRGEHPKMGMVKKRVMPEDVLLNCSKDSVIPVPPKGHRWKEVKHDNTVTWLASWTENVQGQVKYVMLNPSSKLKGEKDWQKYETARKLASCINKIRETYTAEWKAKEMKVRQRAVALYFIDRLALRAGNEKDEDQADTVGCCSLRVEHIELHKEKDGKEYVVVFDFLGKDSIRYYNEVPVEKRVFKNLELFKENKKEGDDLFDRLNTTVLNEHLRELMEGLTAKVFRTYNASITLQNQLKELTDPDASLPEKILAYNRANRAVAILCNHQRAVPKSHDKSMSNLREKMNQKREQIEELEAQVRDAAKAAKRGSVKEKVIHEKKSKALDKLREQLKRMEVQETDRDENKTIALGTSKLNYLDPRISVAWCKKFGVPIEKIYNKTQRDKFRWAIDMATEDYIF